MGIPKYIFHEFSVIGKKKKNSSRGPRHSRESRNKEGEFFGNGKCEFQRHNGHTGSVKGETKSAIFGKGKCELIANFSATMMTSLPAISLSLSLSLCISLSLSPSVPHAQYKKRGSASYIVREVLLVRERERDTEKEREIDGSDVTIVAL